MFLKRNYYSWHDTNQQQTDNKVSRGVLRRCGWLGKPSGVEKLFMSPDVVANETNLLPLSHPSQHDFHVILACQIFQSNFLKSNISTLFPFNQVYIKKVNYTNIT